MPTKSGHRVTVLVRESLAGLAGHELQRVIEHGQPDELS